MGNFMKTTAIGGLLFLIPIETIGGVAFREGSWKGRFHRWADTKMIVEALDGHAVGMRKPRYQRMRFLLPSPYGGRDHE
jgi:hypothetical protein